MNRRNIRTPTYQKSDKIGITISNRNTILLTDIELVRCRIYIAFSVFRTKTNLVLIFAKCAVI